ncbi:trypsin zeta-like isoform X2 [Drosophila kikkawai]|nr:trypsin zeta-like isoform X2 [Drosophila kikkawai]
MHRNRFVVIVAGNFIRLDYRNKYTVNRTVKGIFVPDGFTAENTHNIALIKLAKSLPLDNPNVGVINLPKAEPKPGLNYTVLGWGRMMKDGFMSSQIMSIDVELFSQESCEEMLNTFIDEMMCARNKNGDQNACAGDTGSPLILNETVYGVVSYRIGCGSEILPTVYTNVFMHLKWIEDVMKKNSANHLKPLIMFPIITPIVLLIGNKILKGFRLYLITI